MSLKYEPHPPQVAKALAMFIKIPPLSLMLAAGLLLRNVPGPWRELMEEVPTSSSSSLLLSSLELSDTTIYEPHIRALLGNAPHISAKQLCLIAGARDAAEARGAPHLF